MATSETMPPIPRQPSCPQCEPHEAHILPCDRIDCDCVAAHPYGGREDEWIGRP